MKSVFSIILTLIAGLALSGCGSLHYKNSQAYQDGWNAEFHWVTIGRENRDHMALNNPTGLPTFKDCGNDGSSMYGNQDAEIDPIIDPYPQWRKGCLDSAFFGANQDYESSHKKQ